MAMEGIALFSGIHHFSIISSIILLLACTAFCISLLSVSPYLQDLLCVVMAVDIYIFPFDKRAFFLCDLHGLSGKDVPKSSI